MSSAVLWTCTSRAPRAVNSGGRYLPEVYASTSTTVGPPVANWPPLGPGKHRSVRREAAVRHGGAKALTEQERRVKIVAHRQAPVVVGQLVHGRPQVDAGGVNQDVGLPVPGKQFARHLVDVLAVREVRADPGGGAAGGLDVRGGLLQRLRATRHEHHGGARAR